MDIQVGDRIEYLDSEGNKYKMIIDSISTIENFEILFDESRILKIERPKYEVVEEKKELLTDEEKEFLKQYIKMSPINIKYITKEFNSNTLITIRLNDGQGTAFCTYYTTDYFKVLEEDKEYTLKELGLEA